MGDTVQPREPDRIRCLECGRWYRALPTHLLRTHGLDDEGYRLKHGLPVGVALVCEEWSDNQRRHNHARELWRTLKATGPPPGYRQRESVRVRRAGDYARLAGRGTAAASEVDRTARRREQLRPYPVTVSEAVERLGCSRRAAYTFLSTCVARGVADADRARHLRRSGNHGG